MSSIPGWQAFLQLPGSDGISYPVPPGAPLQYLDGGNATYGAAQSSPAIAASFTTAPFLVKLLDQFSLQISTPASSSLVGSFAFQCSNDPGQKEPFSDVTLFNWSTLGLNTTNGASSTALVTTLAIASGAQALMLREALCHYRWFRSVFTWTSGSGLVRMNLQGKSW